MQPTVKAALLCDYAMTSDDGKLSVLGIFGNINLPNLPGACPPFFVVFILALDAGQQQLRLGILDPSGGQVLPEPPVFDVNVEMPGADTNLVVHLNNLPLQRAGIYQVQLFLEGRMIHSMPLGVQALAPQGAQPLRPN